jgi:subtilisin-like proprotein convertase family protein
VLLLAAPTFSAAATYTSDEVPREIPDGAGFVVSHLLVGEAGSIADIDVFVEASHPRVGDLVFTLTQDATGKSVTIIDRPLFPGLPFGCELPGVQVTLSDEGAGPVESQCQALGAALYGVRQPNNPLSAFDGEAAAGNWTLTVRDEAGGSSGALGGWGIDLTVSHQLTAVIAGSGGGTVTAPSGVELNGIQCGADCAEHYVAGTLVTLTATAAPGSVFTHWSGGNCTATGPGLCQVTMSAARTVTAYFDVPQCTPVGATVPSQFDGTEAVQTARMTRDGFPSTCAGKTFPGPWPQANYQRSHAFKNCSAAPECVTVSTLKGTIGSNFFTGAYLGSYDPANLATNYVGDPGASGNVSFSFTVPAGGVYLLAATSVNSGVGTFSYRFAEKKQVCPTCTYQSIQSAVTAAGFGDTVRVMAGNYAENVVAEQGGGDLTLSCGWDAGFTGQIRDPLRTVIDGDVNGDGEGDSRVLFFHAGQGESLAVTVDNCTITNGSADWGSGVGAAVSGNGYLKLTLRNNVITENVSGVSGAVMARAPYGMVDLSLQNNVIARNTAGEGGGGVAAYAYGASGWVNIASTNNTITANTAAVGGGLYVWSDVSATVRATLQNDILWGNAASAAGADLYHLQTTGSAVVTARNCDVGEVATEGTFSGEYHEIGPNFNVDPIFVDPAVLNYRLNADSPLRDFGDGTGAPATDFEGQARPQGAAHDIGADEYLDPALPGLKILALNGGEAVPAGQPYHLTWWAPANATSFTLKLSLNNGLTWKTLGTVSDTRHLTWAVPLQPGNRKGLIRIDAFDSANRKVGTDRSDRPFVIEVARLTWPDGGEKLPGGTVRRITWRTNATVRPVDSVKLFSTLDQGRTWKLITTISGANPGLHDWTLPVVTRGKACKVKVVLRDARGATVGVDTSDGYFTIVP